MQLVTKFVNLFYFTCGYIIKSYILNTLEWFVEYSGLQKKSDSDLQDESNMNVSTRELMFEVMHMNFEIQRVYIWAF